jgi:polyhydroxybutyrate depolymerase
MHAPRLLALSAAALLCSCAHFAGGPSAPLAPTATAAADLEPIPSAGCRAGAERGSAGPRTLTSGGRTRRFHLRIPPSGALQTPTPLVLNFHGLMQDPLLQELFSGMTEKAMARGWVLVYPAGLGRSWNAGTCCGRGKHDEVDDVRFVRDLVQQLERELCIDRRRIYATGMSNGGLFSYRLACEASDLFAAIAPVAAVEAVPACTPRRPVPVLAFNGTSDPIVRYQGGWPSSWSDLPSVPETRDRWEKRKQCTARQTIWSSKEVKCEASTGCTADHVLCSVEGGGHTWPGGMIVPFLGHTTDELSATDAMLDFFAKHAR